MTSRPLLTNRRSSLSRAVAVLCLLGVSCFADAALAVVIPRITLLTTSVPANGVLRFSNAEGLSVRILRADGSEVAGSFIAPSVWRPEALFELGTYAADITWEEHASWVEDAMFEVTPAVEPSSALIELEVSSVVEADRTQVLDQVCCLAGESLSVGPCEGGGPPLCVPTVHAGKQVFTVTVQWPSDNLREQLEVTPVETTAAGDFTEGYWDVLGSPDELCGVVEVFSWLDESRTVTRQCIPNPRPQLNPVAETFISFGTNSECTIPPAGYEEEWCEGRGYICDALVMTPKDQQDPEAQLGCEHYTDVCSDVDPTNPSSDEATEPPPADADASTDSTAEAPDTASSGDSPDDTREDSPDDDNELAEPKLRRVEPSKGCSVTLAPTRSSWALVHRLTFVAGLAWLVRFRRKRR